MADWQRQIDTLAVSQILVPTTSASVVVPSWAIFGMKGTNAYNVAQHY